MLKIQCGHNILSNMGCCESRGNGGFSTIVIMSVFERLDSPDVSQMSCSERVDFLIGVFDFHRGLLDRSDIHTTSIDWCHKFFSIEEGQRGGRGVS